MIRERGHRPRMQVAFKRWQRQRNRFHSTASRSNSALFDTLILVWKYLFKISDLQSGEVISLYQVTKYAIIRKPIQQVSLLFQVYKAWLRLVFWHECTRTQHAVFWYTHARRPNGATLCRPETATKLVVLVS